MNFYLVWDVNQSGEFISAIVWEDSPEGAISFINLSRNKFLGPSTELHAQMIDFDRGGVGIYYEVRKEGSISHIIS